MDPHERASRFPAIHGITLRKPPGCTMMMRFACKVVIYIWIWGRQPTAKLLLELVTYKVVTVYMPQNGNIKTLRTFQLVCFDCHFLHQHWRIS